MNLTNIWYACTPMSDPSPSVTPLWLSSRVLHTNVRPFVPAKLHAGVKPFVPVGLIEPPPPVEKKREGGGRGENVRILPLPLFRWQLEFRCFAEKYLLEIYASSADDARAKFRAKIELLRHETRGMVPPSRVGWAEEKFSEFKNNPKLRDLDQRCGLQFRPWYRKYPSNREYPKPTCVTLIVLTCCDYPLWATGVTDSHNTIDNLIENAPLIQSAPGKGESVNAFLTYSFE